MSVKKRAERIQLDLIQNAKDLGARDPRSAVLAEMKSYGTEGQYIALVVGRYGEFPRDFAKMRDYIAREKARAYNEHSNFIGQHGHVDVQAKYHVPLGADGGARLGPAYP